MFMIFLFLAVQSVTAPQASNLDRAWDILKQGVADANADKRAKAVHALGLVPDNTEIRQMAEAALTDENADVRTEAATALGNMHAVASRPKLRDALKDTEPKVVLAVTNALYELKDPIAYEIYYAMVTGQQKTKDSLLQTQLDALHSRKQMEKLAFETGIGFVPFGSVAFETWKTITRDDSSAVLAQALGRLYEDPDPKSEKAIEDACYDPKWQVRTAAVNALAKRGDPSTLDYVVSAMQDENSTVEYQAAAAVVVLSTKRKPLMRPRPQHQPVHNTNP